jgi:hypothetical protein
MDFWKTMGVLLRRWYVSVPVFVLSLVLGAGVFVAVPTQYESTGTIVLTAPTSGGVTVLNPKDATGPGNPLLDFEGSLTITTQLLIQSLSSPTVQNQIAAQGGAKTFQAGDGETGGPFVVIIADATSRQTAEKTVSLALKYADSELNTRQQNLHAPASTFIGTQVVVAATPATTKLGGKVRGGGVALALGLVLSLAAAFAVESMKQNRRRTDDERPSDSRLAADDDDLPEDRAAVTRKMRPAPPPPRPMAQPVRGAQRPASRPQVTPVGGNGRRESFSPNATHKPHPAKPRVHPTPVPNTNGAKANDGAKSHNGSTNNNHDWPRAEFHSPDSTNG